MPRTVSSLQEDFRSAKAEYSMARDSRFRRKRTGVNWAGSSADYHYSESAYLRMLELARAMDRDDCVIGQTIQRAVDNTVQDGIAVDPQTGSDELDELLWQRWYDWGKDPDQCDLAGELTWPAMQALAFRHMLADGDVIALPTSEGSLELIEGHRPRTPSNTTRNVVCGVLLDDRRRRLEYWLTKDDVSPLAAVRAVSDIKAYKVRDEDGHRQLFHLYNPKRVSQTRGVTALAPIVDVCGMFEDIQFAKLVQQQIVSCFVIFRERDPDSGLPGLSQATGAVTNDTHSDGTAKRIEGLAPGLQLTGAPGEKLTGFAPNVPNAEFFDHVKLMLTLIGVNLGLPLALVMLDGSETNFSGWRGAVDQARLGFKANQRALIQRLIYPAYKWKVRSWLETDPALAALAGASGVDPFACAFNPPSWPYIEPLKDASADLLRQRNALSSPRRIQAERGREWETVATEIIDDNAYAIVKAKTKAKEINGKFPDDPVHWRELISLPTPDGVTVSLSGEEPTQTNNRTGRRSDDQQ